MKPQNRSIAYHEGAGGPIGIGYRQKATTRNSEPTATPWLHGNITASLGGDLQRPWPVVDECDRRRWRSNVFGGISADRISPRPVKEQGNLTKCCRALRDQSGLIVGKP